MNGFERRTQQKKDQIIRASLDLFRKRGFKKVSMTEIARRAGVSQVTIYNYFGSKSDLVKSSLLSFFEDKLSEYADILSSEKPYFERLQAVILDKSALIEDFGGEMLDEVNLEHPDLLEELRNLRRKAYEEVTVPFLAEGRSLGFVNEEISDDAVIRFIEIFRQWLPQSLENDPKMRSNPALLKELYQLILYGIYGATGTPDS